MIDEEGRETKTVVEAHLYQENDKLREVIKILQKIISKHIPPDGTTSEVSKSLIPSIYNKELFKLLNDTDSETVSIMPLKEGATKEVPKPVKTIRGPYGPPPLSWLVKIYEDLNIELEKLELKDGDIVIIKVKKEMGLTGKDLSYYAHLLQDSSALKDKDFHVVAIDGDVNIKVVTAREDDILLVRSSDMSAVDKANFAEFVRCSPAYLNKKAPNIVFIDGDKDLESVSESDMNQAGWFRKSMGRR